MEKNCLLTALLSCATPVKLFTYETASARSRILELEKGDLYSLVSKLVEKHFGAGHMDNKITMVFIPKDSTVPVYLSYWDGKLSVGLDVYMFRDVTKAMYNYCVVLPIRTIKRISLIPNSSHPAVGSKVMIVLSDNEIKTTVEDTLLGFYGNYGLLSSLVGKRWMK